MDSSGRGGARHFSDGKIGSGTLLILVNGLIVAVILFAALHLTLADMKTVEARKVTRDILHEIEQSLTGIEKTVRTLGYFYSSVSSPDSEEALAVTQGMQKLLTEDQQLSGFLWATDGDVWHQEDLRQRTEHNVYRPSLGWPDYNFLQKALQKIKYNEVFYLQDMNWPAFEKEGTAAIDAPVGMAMKIRLSGGGQGILLAITTPARIFGNRWQAQRDDIAGVTIRDRETGFVMFEAVFPPPRLDKDIALPEKVTDVLQLGNKYWDIHFDVRLSALARALSLSPWGILGLILLLTAGAAFFAERKHRQDVMIAEMSKNLEGTQSELQSKTSERDKLFYALRKSERESRAMINSVAEVIFETDESGRITFLNETWKKMTLREPTEVLGESLFSLLDPSDRDRQKDMFDELVRGERQAYRIETQLMPARGTAKPVEIAFSMLRMTEEKSIRVVGTLTDIEQRHLAEKAMREAEQKFRAIFENSVSGIYQASPDGNYISANPAMAEILGYTSADDLISSVSNIGQTVYVQPEQYKFLVQKLLFEGYVSGLEAEVYRKNGQKIWVMENVRIVRSDKGAVHHYEGSIWDVTERKKAEEAMRHAKIQAELASRTRMEFLANMSHELRTPLNAVIGFSQILKDEVMGPIGIESYKDYARDIFDSGNHLLRIISDILEVSKIETGNRELNIGNFPLARVMKSCMTILAPRIEQAGVDVKVELPEGLPEMLGEELGLKQIMINLVSNAVKFTPKGGVVRIAAATDTIGGMMIDVTDTGVGMTEEEIRTATQPFSKIDMSFTAVKSGTGLGLTIVDSLVRLHGGHFKLISEKGKGTTARITLPPKCVLKSDGSSASGHLKVVK